MPGYRNAARLLVEGPPGRSSDSPLLSLRPSLQGRFTIAAKHHISIAEIYESELVDIEKVNTPQFISDSKLFTAVSRWLIESSCWVLPLFKHVGLMDGIFCSNRQLHIMNKQQTTTKGRSQTGTLFITVCVYSHINMILRKFACFYCRLCLVMHA